MKRILFFITAILASSLVFGATKVTLENNLSLTFEGNTDGSVRIEACAPNGSAPAKAFELKRIPDKANFLTQPDGSLTWQNYTVILNKNGYTLILDEKPLYEASFKIEKKNLREIRTWSSAKQFYGFGEASRYANLSNQSFTIFNVSKYGDHANLFIPFYITDTNLSVYYNANGKDWIYFQHDNDSQAYTSEYFRIESFIRQDTNRNESVAKFYEEVGGSCMMPKWVFGYIQSKYGYKSCDEVIELVDDFKKRNIPLSAVVLDLYWFKKMGDISWTSPDFANYAQMDKYMEDNGVKLITITEPFFSTASANYKELSKSGLICKNAKNKPVLWRDWWLLDKDKEGGLFNPLGKKASKFMGEKYKAMLDSGIDGFWTDLGEPEGAKSEIMFGKLTEKDFHNYYNYYWSKALYEGMEKTAPDKRIFIMSRSGYTGSGKFNVSVWSGDAAVSWPSLAQQIAYGTNVGICGIPYWGSDVGGFTPEKSPEDLYLRWQQFGAFTPIYRAHGTGPREPYAYSEKTESIVTDLIRKRIEMVPYIYSTARQTMSGKPMMRPMYLEDDSTPVEFMGSQYMFGDSILVSPISKPADQESEHKTYLPKGNWYDFFTGEKVSSQGSVITTKNQAEKIPVYIKEGAIIPCEKIENENKLQVVKVYAAKDSKNTFVWYNDDGETNQYKNGSFTEVQFTLDCLKLTAEIRGTDSFLPEEFEIVNPLSGKSQKVTIEQLKAGIEL